MRRFIILLVLMVLFSGCEVISKYMNHHNTVSLPNKPIEGDVSIEIRLAADTFDESLPVLTIKGKLESVRLGRRVWLNEKDIAEVKAERPLLTFLDGSIVVFTFTEAGSKKFEELTKDNIGKRMAIIVDGELISAPYIREAVSRGKAELVGYMSYEEADLMVERIMGRSK